MKKFFLVLITTGVLLSCGENKEKATLLGLKKTDFISTLGLVLRTGQHLFQEKISKVKYDEYTYPFPYGKVSL